MRQTILLTGATGFLGSHLLESFVNEQYDVIILKRTTSDTSRINHLLSKVRVYNIDKVDFKTVFTHEKVDVIINTVCSYGRTNESLIDIVNSNLIFGLNLLDEAVKNNVQTFINTDTLLLRNVNAYSLSKAQFVDWLHLYCDKIQTINFRIEHMYGPGDDKKKFIPWLVNQMINNNDDILLTSGIQKRDFIHIDDVVTAYNLVLQKAPTLGEWNQFDLGSNTFTEVKEVVLQIAEKIHHIKHKAIVPRLKFGALSYRLNDCMEPSLNIKSLVKLGWNHTTNVHEGIGKYVDILMKDL